MRHWFFGVSAVVLGLVAMVASFWTPAWFALIVVVPIILLGVRDSLQTRRAILRNFPVLGHFRYLFEKIRPEINQYFVESNTDGMPFSRNMRSVVYQRAKRELETIPFGTQRNVYEVGYEWFNHSILAIEAAENPRIRIGEGRARMPYDASVYNISAMSFGSLSANAIRALNGGAKIGGFFHNTGEGGISDHHLEHGGDLVWQIGTGYFGCRNRDGTFNEEKFAKNASRPTVRMIEVKLSQGAKPGHGGISEKGVDFFHHQRRKMLKLGRECAGYPDMQGGAGILAPGKGQFFGDRVPGQHLADDGFPVGDNGGFGKAPAAQRLSRDFRQHGAQRNRATAAALVGRLVLSSGRLFRRHFASVPEVSESMACYACPRWGTT